VSSSSGVYSGAGSEGSNSPDSHHVARLLVTQGSDVPLLTARRHSRDHHQPPAAKEALSAGGRSDLLLAKAASVNGDRGGSEREVAASSNSEASAATAAGGGQFPKCGRRMVERANSRVANLSGLVRLPFARLPSQQQQLQQQQQHQHQLSAAGNGSRQLREF
jgi:hypothetical protein